MDEGALCRRIMTWRNDDSSWWDKFGAQKTQLFIRGAPLLQSAGSAGLPGGMVSNLKNEA